MKIKKKTTKEDNSTLSLHLTSTKCTAPDLSCRFTVPLRYGSDFLGMINGKPLRICVDSGTSSCLMTHKVATQLGIMNYAVGTKEVMLATWDKMMRYTATCLDNVRLDLPGGGLTYLAIDVYPKSMDDQHDKLFLDMIYGVNQLRHDQIIQSFSSNGYVLNDQGFRLDVEGALHFKHKTIKKRTVPRAKGPGFLLKCKADAAKSGREVNMCVDTGAYDFYLSPDYLKRSGLEERPKDINLHVHKDLTIKHAVLEKSCTKYDVFMGKNVMARQNCILDYRRNIIYFKPEGGDVYKSRLTAEGQKRSSRRK